MEAGPKIAGFKLVFHGTGLVRKCNWGARTSTRQQKVQSELKGKVLVGLCGYQPALIKTNYDTPGNPPQGGSEGREASRGQSQKQNQNQTAKGGNQDQDQTAKGGNRNQDQTDKGGNQNQDQTDKSGNQDRDQTAKGGNRTKPA